MINEQAGSGSAKGKAQQLFAYAQENNLDFRLSISEYPHHTTEIVQSLLSSLSPWSEDVSVETFPLLVIVGGDGTLNDALNGLTNGHSDIPLAYIPCGTGNDFARAAGISLAPIEAFQQILHCHQPRVIPAIKYEEKITQETHYFVNNTGIGLDAAIVYSANHSNLKAKFNQYHLGNLIYVTAALKNLFRQKGFPIRLVSNGQELSYQRAFLCTVTNHPYFGGGVGIAPEQKLVEKSISLVVVERISLIKIFYLLLLLLKGNHLKSRSVHIHKASTIQLISILPQHGQRDGEEMGKRSYDLTFSIHEQLFWGI